MANSILQGSDTIQLMGIVGQLIFWAFVLVCHFQNMDSSMLNCLNFFFELLNL